MPPGENLDLWAEDAMWPEAPLNSVFLLDLVVEVARRMLGSDWSAPFVPTDDPQGFQRVARRIAEAGEAGRLDVRYGHPDGELVPVRSGDWRSWRDLFITGHLLVEIRRLEDGFVRVTYPSDSFAQVTRVYSCPIFVRRDDKLDRFLKGIRASKPKRRGRPQKYDWEAAFKFMRDRLDVWGDPKKPENRFENKKVGKRLVNWRSDTDVAVEVAHFLREHGGKEPDTKHTERVIRPELTKYRREQERKSKG
jgi:hypothetical protein